MEKMVSKLPKAENDGRGSVDYGHLVPDVEILQLTSNDHTTILKQHLLEQQDGKCCLCERDITKEKQHLDHSHRARIGGTGLIRGTLCSGCNMFLGKVENNFKRNGITIDSMRKILPNMVNYLFDKPHHPFVHEDLAPLPKRLMKTSYNKLIAKYKELNKSMEDVPDYPKRQYITDKMKRAFAAVDMEPEYYKD